MNASLDNSTRVLTWTLTAIDPATGSAVNSGTRGFLPPNDANGSGQGFVGYSIQPKASSETNSRIDAQANIVFDGQAPIQTIPVFNTLDAGAPVSQVSSLPSISEPTFAVSWTGSDEGIGIASYDIYVRIDNGAFTLWQDDTISTSATYTGQAGKTYAFYSIATDRLGLSEDAPSQPDAITIASNPSITLAVAPASGVIENSIRNLVYTFSRTGPTITALTVNYTVAGSASLGSAGLI